MFVCFQDGSEGAATSDNSEFDGQDVAQAGSEQGLFGKGKKLIKNIGRRLFGRVCSMNYFHKKKVLLFGPSTIL